MAGMQLLALRFKRVPNSLSLTTLKLDSFNDLSGVNEKLGDHFDLRISQLSITYLSIC